MIRLPTQPSLLVTVVVAGAIIAAGAAPATASAGPEALPTSNGDRPASAAATPAAPGPATGATTTTTPATGSATGTGAPAPADAAAAIERARAAYEYGDIDEVVAWARPVAEGNLQPTTAQRAQALRFLGIGLYLTGRVEGAETAFFQLLRLRPTTRLDPKTTRPDVVAFFETVRRGHEREIKQAAQESNPKRFLWNFLPPAGQFQNGHRGRGYTLAGLELLSLGTAAVTRLLLASWEQDHHEFPDHYEDARTARTVNVLAVSIFAFTYLYGVIDGIAHYGDAPADPDPAAPSKTAGLRLAPGGFALEF